MSKNQELFNAINNMAELSPEKASASDAALDALLAVDVNNAEAFRKAVASFASFWVESNAELKLEEAGGSFEDEAVLDSEDTDVSFLKIKQTAAKQRVKFSLNLTDKEILLHILENNPEQCRAYLASLENSPLSKINGWQPSVKPETGIDINPSQDILPDKAIIEIRQFAVAHLALLAVEEASLEQLITFASDDDLISWVKETVKDDDVIDIGLVKKIIEARVSERKKELLGSNAFTHYKKYLEALNNEEILGFDEVLTKTSADDIRSSLPSIAGIDDISKNALSDENSFEIKKLIAIRYLKAVLVRDVAKNDDENYLAVLQATDLSTVQEKLSVLYPDIANLITEAEIEPVKQVIADELIKKIHEQLRKIPFENVDELIAFDRPKALADFKKLLTSKASISEHVLPYLTENHMYELQQTARSGCFDIQVNHVSSLGIVAHSALAKLFADLSPQDQRQFMGNYNSSRHVLRRVINSTDSDYIKHYLPDVTPSVIDAVVQENRHSSSFRRIHNAAIAQILATMSPPFTLDESKVGEINQKLLDSTSEDLEEEQYIAFVKTITQIIANDESAIIYQAFGLNEDATSIVQQDLREQIQQQHQYNAVLSEQYEASDKLLSFLLTIKKDQELKQSAIEEIKKLISESSNFNAFLTALLKGKTPLRENIINQISPSMFYGIKKQMRTQILDDLDSPHLKTVIAEIKTALKVINESNLSLAKHMEKIQFIFKIDDIHLFNPLFQNNAQSMLKKYTELSEQVKVIIEKLRQDVDQLQNYRDSMSRPSDLRTKLTEELTLTERQLMFYEQVQGTLLGESGILKKIATVINRTHGYTYEPQGITSDLIEEGKVKSEPIKSSPSEVLLTTADGLDEGEIAAFFLKEKPKKGWVRHFDVVQTINHEENIIKTEGRFTYDATYGDAPLTSKGHQLSPSLKGKFEIRQFPKPIDPVGKPNEIALKKAKMNFALAMAAQIIATLDSPPTKEKPIRLRGINEEELSYLWTALAIIGEKSTKMRFSTDAIRVSSDAFNPETQRGFFGFNSDSIYHTVFKKYGTTLIKETIAASNQHTDERLNTKEARKQMGQVEGTTQFFRDKLTATKESVAQRLEDEGPSPKPSSF